MICLFEYYFYCFFGFFVVYGVSYSEYLLFCLIYRFFLVKYLIDDYFLFLVYGVGMGLILFLGFIVWACDSGWISKFFIFLVIRIGIAIGLLDKI